MWISHGVGSKIYDVDGTEYSDFHGGYGVSARRPRPSGDRQAVSERVRPGTHFAQPVPDAVAIR